MNTVNKEKETINLPNTVEHRSKIYGSL